MEVIELEAPVGDDGGGRPEGDVWFRGSRICVAHGSCSVVHLVHRATVVLEGRGGAGYSTVHCSSAIVATLK